MALGTRYGKRGLLEFLHYSGDMTVRMRQVTAKPQAGLIGSFTATRVAIQTKNFPFSSLLCNSTTTVHRMFRRLEAAVESSDRCFFVFVLPTFRSCAKKKNESEKLIKNIDRAIV